VVEPAPAAVSAPVNEPVVVHEDDEPRRIVSTRPAPGETRPAAAPVPVAPAAQVAPVVPVAARPLPTDSRPAARPAASVAASAPAAARWGSADVLLWPTDSSAPRRLAADRSNRRTRCRAQWPASGWRLQRSSRRPRWSENRHGRPTSRWSGRRPAGRLRCTATRWRLRWSATRARWPQWRSWRRSGRSTSGWRRPTAEWPTSRATQEESCPSSS
jgi:hypothetical protein